MKYNGALIPATTMPIYVEPDRDQALRALDQCGALFLRYTTVASGQPTNWWHITIRNYDFRNLSSNTRSKIRRGLKRLEIGRVSPAWLADHGYESHVSSYARYRLASAMSQETFRTFMLGLEGLPIFDVWACCKEHQVLGYIICLRDEKGVFLHTIDLTPVGLHAYAAYGMLHRILEHYVNDKSLPVSNGSRSIAHATEIQDFLLKFGFQREYGYLHVIYRPDVALAVYLLYPVRHMLKALERIPLMHKITAVLYQEEIRRKQNTVLTGS